MASLFRLEYLPAEWAANIRPVLHVNRLALLTSDLCFVARRSCKTAQFIR